VSTDLASTLPVPRARTPKRLWRPEEDQLLRDLYDGTGASFDALVERLQRSRGSIQMRAIRLGLCSRTSRKWTPEEDAILAEIYDGQDPATISRIATRLKRARIAVVRRAGRLGLQRARERDWTAEEDQQLRDLYDSHPTTVRKLARALGRKSAALKRRASKLGLTRKPGRPWLQREDDLLERLVAQNVSRARMAQALGRTEAAVTHRLLKLGIDARTNVFGIADLATLLGTGEARIRRWIERGLLVTQRTSDADAAHHRVTYRELRKFILRYLHEINFQELERRGSKEAFIDVLLDGQAGQLGAEGFGRGIEDAGALA